ncbi:MAG TPA: hypothetical protein VFJ01_13400 [Oleiagrimonas sp.]|nr:hypothetical protein [Oleiagrimonas sp.]HET7301636.1 hypothetical protein [Oleiagrimonas sp.]
MTLTDGFDHALTDPAVITRSDHAPTEYERYGDWARKFFGYGYHQEYKDSEATRSRLASLVGLLATHH